MEQRALMVEPLDDEHIIEACQHGDREAFRLLFETHKDRVYSIAIYFFHGEEQTARDVTQQVFLKLITTISQFRRDAEFTTWLYRMVVNQCMDEQRKRRRFLPFGDAVKMDAKPERRDVAEERYARVEMAEAVQEAVTHLKPKLRLAMLLKYIEGLSYEEMAEVLKCSKGTVASRLNRGHKILAQRLAHLRGEFIAGD